MTTDAAPSLARLQKSLSEARKELGQHVIGQQNVIDLTLIALLCRGHALLLGVPGLAKTKLVDTVGHVLGLDFRRVQCTPDLLPADVLGSEILEQDESGRRHFRFVEGPIFTQLLMVDEINRASPRTQSAFLQAMQERHVTVAGRTLPLPAPFHVLATQNPIEHEGTYPLPEAQLDRFLLQIDVDYPDRAAEKDILRATTTGLSDKPKTILNAKDLQELQNLVEQMPIGDSVVEAILTLVRRARPGADSHPVAAKYLEWAPGIRASQALSLASRARALLHGRTTPSIDDVIALAPAALKHRLRLNYLATAEGQTTQDILAALTQGL